MFRKRPSALSVPSSAVSLLSQFSNVQPRASTRTTTTTTAPSHLTVHSDTDENKYHKQKRRNRRSQKKQVQQQRRFWNIVAVCLCLYVLKRMIFPLSHDGINYVDRQVRNLWLLAERCGIVEKFPVYKTDYDTIFPYFSLLEENHHIIREEAMAILEQTRNHIPRLKDLVEHKRSESKVYTTDWKTYWFKMGQYIPENEARAPKTAALLHQIPDVYNAFFSVLEPHQHIDPHWGHYKGFLRYHLGVIVPQNNVNKDCYLRIRNDIEKNTSLWLYEREELLSQGTHYYWHEGEGVMFDDNPLHDATNESDEERVVLFLDVARPLPWYLDILNRIAIFVANRQGQIVNMRKRAVINENQELSVG